MNLNGVKKLGQTISDQVKAGPHKNNLNKNFLSGQPSVQFVTTPKADAVKLLFPLSTHPLKLLETQWLIWGTFSSEHIGTSINAIAWFLNANLFRPIFLKKCTIPGLIFLYFCLFSAAFIVQLIVNLIWNKIRTADLWCWKEQLYHWPNYLPSCRLPNFMIAFLRIFYLNSLSFISRFSPSFIFYFVYRPFWTKSFQYLNCSSLSLSLSLSIHKSCASIYFTTDLLLLSQFFSLAIAPQQPVEQVFGK